MFDYSTVALTRPGVSYVRVVISWMVEVVTDARGEQHADVLTRQLVPQLAEMHETVHHLRDAETVTEVVERVVAVVLLNAQLHDKQRRCFHLHATNTVVTGYM